MRTMRSEPEGGYTLIEMLVTLFIGALLLTLSASALRNFWLNQSLDASTNSLVTDLRKQQQESVSQSHPLVFGARFTLGASTWTLYTFDPGASSEPTDDTCTSATRTFDTGAFNARVEVSSISITNVTSSPEFVKCSGGDNSAKILFFYARGTATGGSVVLQQPSLGRSQTVTVSAATGRVTRT